MEGRFEKYLNLFINGDKTLQKWKDGELLFWEHKNELYTKEELAERFDILGINIDWDNEDDVKEIFDKEQILTFDQFINSGRYEITGLEWIYRE